MRLPKSFLLILFVFFLFYSCSKNQTKKDESQQNKKDNKEKPSNSDSNSQLSKYDFSSENPQIINLPPELKEISGITMTPDGRLLAEQDEQGIVYQIDYKTGDIIKKFSLGKPPIKRDFEDIVFINDKIYMLHSKGEIYEFKEGDNGESVDFKVHKVGLTHENDVEGMCYDKETNSLLLACKGNPGVDDDMDKAIYSFSLDSMKFDPKPRFLIKKSDIKNYFNPSGIQRNPVTGTFFVIAANGNAIVEISKEGKFLGKASLPKKIHPQPEGITFSDDGTLFISNEGKEGGGNIVIYPLKK